MKELKVELLTQACFAPFGDVIEIEGRDLFYINQGQTERFHALAHVDIEDQSPPIISFFRAQPSNFPIKIDMLERHPLGSQAMFPIAEKPFLIVVAKPGDVIDPSSIRAFLTNGKQGINYHKGTWHFPTLALHCVTKILVVDRGGKDNCDEQPLESPLIINGVE